MQREAAMAVARNIVLRAAVADRQLASAAAAADKTGEQGVAVLGRTMMPTCRDVLTYHPADRLCALPIEITFVRVGFSASHSARGLRRLLVPTAGPLYCATAPVLP